MVNAKDLRRRISLRSNISAIVLYGHGSLNLSSSVFSRNIDEYEMNELGEAERQLVKTIVERKGWLRNKERPEEGKWISRDRLLFLLEDEKTVRTIVVSKKFGL